MNEAPQKPQEAQQDQGIQDQGQWDVFGWLNENIGEQEEIQEQIPPVVDFGQIGENHMDAANNEIHKQGLGPNQQGQNGQQEQWNNQQGLNNQKVLGNNQQFIPQNQEAAQQGPKHQQNNGN